MRTKVAPYSGHSRFEHKRKTIDVLYGIGCAHFRIHHQRVIRDTVKYFYDANVGRTAHLWKIHDTYCRFRMNNAVGNRELHHDKGVREVCHKCLSNRRLNNQLEVH